MKPIEDLKMEHEAVKLTLKILDKICSNIEQTGKISSPEHLDQLIEFFIVFVDGVSSPESVSTRRWLDFFNVQLSTRYKHRRLVRERT